MTSFLTFSYIYPWASIFIVLYFIYCLIVNSGISSGKFIYENLDVVTRSLPSIAGYAINKNISNLNYFPLKSDICSNYDKYNICQFEDTVYGLYYYLPSASCEKYCPKK